MKSPNYFSFQRAIPILIRSRLEIIFVWPWVTAASCLIVGKGFPPLVSSLTSVIAMFFISMSVYIYNDVIDADMDKLNPVKKSRPIPSGKVSKEYAMCFIYLSAIIGIFLISITNIYSLVFSFLYLFLFTLYSYPGVHLKKKFLFKEFIIALGWPLSSLVASYAVANRFSFNAFFAGIFFAIFAFMGMPALNDSMDIESDILQGVKSLAVVLSWKRKVQLMIIGVLIIMTLSPLTYINLGFNILLPIFVVAGSLIFLRFVSPIMINVEKIEVVDVADLIKARRIAHLYFILLQIFMIIGSLNIAIFHL